MRIEYSATWGAFRSGKAVALPVSRIWLSRAYARLRWAEAELQAAYVRWMELETLATGGG